MSQSESDIPLPFNESVFDAFPLLETKRLLLRQVESADAGAILSLFADERMVTWSGKEVFRSLSEAQDWISKHLDLYANREGLPWILELKETKTAIGSLAFWKLLKQHRRAELGYSLNTACWKKGYMQEALEAVLGFGFKTMHLHSVEANITPGNVASENLLLRNGFVQEGLFKENFRGVNGFLDTASYSLIANP